MLDLPNDDDAPATESTGSGENAASPAETPPLPALFGEHLLTTEEAARYHDAAEAELSHRELELERRERELEERSAALKQEEKSQRRAEQEIDRRREAADSKAAAAQAELNSRLERCEELITDLERAQTATEAERGLLESHRETLRQTLLDEQVPEREEFDQDRQRFQIEKKGYRKRVEDHEREMSTARQEQHDRWESERQALREQLTAKIASEHSEQRQTLDEERTSWEIQRDLERETLDEERAKHEELLVQAESGLDRIRQELEQEFQERRRALEAEIGAQVASLETRIAEQQSDWEISRQEAETELETLRTELETQRTQQDEALKASQTKFEEFREYQLQRIEDEDHQRRSQFEQERLEWIAERDAIQSRLDAEAAMMEDRKSEFENEYAAARADLEKERDCRRGEIEQEIASQRTAFDAECESIRRALDEERAVAENRLHFQRDHLDRTRDELETARNEVDLRIQQGRARVLELTEGARLRCSQLEHFRELLDQRESSLAREWQMLAEARDQIESNLVAENDRQIFPSDLPARDHQVEQLAEQERREELAESAKQIAQRQARLDTLRVEIESTHRESLELRVALDETWARLEQSAGGERAKEELFVSRERVAAYFRKKDAAIEQRRALLASDAENARKQRESLDHRRRELSDWLAGSLATLRQREEHLQRWSGALETRQSREEKSKSRWHNEKLEAERVIRDLLRQLEEAVAGPPRLTFDGSFAAVSESREPRRAAG